jgi:hypothetical protein
MNLTRIGRTVAAVTAGLSAAVLLAPNPASAAGNDDFAARTTNGCGVANFIDYGPGAPGGGNNDDYIELHDYCADKHGVRVELKLEGEYQGFAYNGNGAAGASVFWDPFRQWGGPQNVPAGAQIWMRVCLVDGPSDTTGEQCGEAWHTSIDG